MENEIILVIAIISIAFGAEAIFGFGGGLISVALLSIFLGVKDAVTLVLIFQLLMGLLIFKNYKLINWKAAKPITGGLVLGTIFGTLALSKIDATFLQIFLALAIIFFLMKMIFFKSFVIKKVEGSVVPSTVGSSAGIIQGLIGTGGQILIMYLPTQLPSKIKLRATLIYLFFVTSIIRIAISVPEGLLTPKILQYASFVLPFFLLAIILGQKFHQKVSAKYYQLAIYLFLSLSAITLLAKTLS